MHGRCVLLFTVLINSLFAGVCDMKTISPDREMSAGFRLLIDVLQQKQLTENRKNNYRKACIAGVASVSALAVAVVSYWLKIHAASLNDDDFLGSRDERNDLHLDIPERSISDE